MNPHKPGAPCNPGSRQAHEVRRGSVKAYICNQQCRLPLGILYACWLGLWTSFRFHLLAGFPSAFGMLASCLSGFCVLAGHPPGFRMLVGCVSLQLFWLFGCCSEFHVLGGCSSRCCTLAGCPSGFRMLAGCPTAFRMLAGCPYEFHMDFVCLPAAPLDIICLPAAPVDVALLPADLLDFVCLPAAPLYFACLPALNTAEFGHLVWTATKCGPHLHPHNPVPLVSGAAGKHTKSGGAIGKHTYAIHDAGCPSIF